MAAASGVSLRRLENIRAGYTDFSEDDARFIAATAGFPLNFFVMRFDEFSSVSDLTFRTTTRFWNGNRRRGCRVMRTRCRLRGSEAGVGNVIVVEGAKSCTFGSG